MPLSASYWSRLSTDPTRYPSMRASDEDRNVVFDALGEAYAQGLLTSEEHTERMEKASKAHTLGEIQPLMEDLVSTPERPDPYSSDRATTSATDLAPRDYDPGDWRDGLSDTEIDDIDRAAHNRYSGNMVGSAAGVIAPFVVCTMIFFNFGAGGFFWPAFIMLAMVPISFAQARRKNKIIQRERDRLARRQRARKYGSDY